MIAWVVNSHPELRRSTCPDLIGEIPTPSERASPKADPLRRRFAKQEKSIFVKKNAAYHKYRCPSIIGCEVRK